MKKLPSAIIPLAFLASASVAAGQENTAEWKTLPAAKLRNAEVLDQKFIENYPTPILRRDVQGEVVVHVRVSTNGRATQCHVASSSGDNILDEWACLGVMRYARFDPATDASGERVEGRWCDSIFLKLGDPKE